MHQTADALEVFDSFSHPDSQQRLGVLAVDYRDPQGGDYHMMSLEADRGCRSEHGDTGWRTNHDSG